MGNSKEARGKRVVQCAYHCAACIIVSCLFGMYLYYLPLLVVLFISVAESSILHDFTPWNLLVIAVACIPPDNVVPFILTEDVTTMALAAVVNRLAASTPQPSTSTSTIELTSMGVYLARVSRRQPKSLENSRSRRPESTSASFVSAFS
jgi:hypothetical protein